MTKGFYKFSKTSNIFTISSTHFWKEATANKKSHTFSGIACFFNYWCSRVWKMSIFNVKQTKGKRVSVWKSFSFVWRKNRLVFTPMFWVSQIITMEIKSKCWPEPSVTAITLSSSGKATFQKAMHKHEYQTPNFQTHLNLSARTASKGMLIVLVPSHFRI